MKKITVLVMLICAAIFCYYSFAEEEPKYGFNQCDLTIKRFWTDPERMIKVVDKTLNQLKDEKAYELFDRNMSYEYRDEVRKQLREVIEQSPPEIKRDDIYKVLKMNGIDIKEKK
jgi:hypothetical protein